MFGGVLSFDGTFLSTPSARRATRRAHLFADGTHISIHALREEGDPSPRSASTSACDFYPRPPRGGRHDHALLCLHAAGISIHALREEGDAFLFRQSPLRCYFYPRPPRGGRRTERSDDRKPHRFLSTPSARRATEPVGFIDPDNKISIHALREEGDVGFPRHADRTEISIHALREEGDDIEGVIVFTHRIFLSTPSARRATAKTETKSLFSNKLYNILHEFRRALIYNGSKSYPNHAK